MKTKTPQAHTYITPCRLPHDHKGTCKPEQGLASPYGVMSDNSGASWTVELNIPGVTREAVYVGLPERTARNFAQCLNSAYVLGAVNERGA